MTSFYRGMGGPFTKDVLKKGLPAGVSITDNLKVATEYANKSAYEIYKGSLGKAARENPATVGYIQRLQKAGLSEAHASIFAPSPFKPTGSIIKVDVDNPSLLHPGLPHLGEKSTSSRIPAEKISVISSGHSFGPEWHRANAPSHMGYSRLTRGQVRLTEKVAKKSSPEQVKSIFKDWNMARQTALPRPTTDQEMSRAARTWKKILGKRLQAARGTQLQMVFQELIKLEARMDSVLFLQHAAKS